MMSNIQSFSHLKPELNYNRKRNNTRITGTGSRGFYSIPMKKIIIN